MRGRVTAVLHCEHHPEFWRELTADHDVRAGRQVSLTLKDLSRAWDVMARRSTDDVTLLVS